MSQNHEPKKLKDFKQLKRQNDPMPVQMPEVPAPVKKPVKEYVPKPAAPERSSASNEEPAAEPIQHPQKKTVKRRKPVNPVKAKHRKINQILMFILLGVSAVTLVALIINTIRVIRTSSVDAEGTQESMSSDTGQTMKNDVYIIGNNPTDTEKEYFQKLTDALKGGVPEEIAEAVVYNFVSDYFTWTNKDGNYEVGGLQYIFAEKYSKFEEWNRWYQYSNMDLYISQYGRENLIQVKSVTTEQPTFKTDDFTVMSVDPAETYPCYQVQVAWTYEDTPVDTTAFPNRMRFQVVDHNGRFEIVEFYDMPSVEAWEAENGSGESGDGTGSSETADPAETAGTGSEG